MWNQELTFRSSKVWSFRFYSHFKIDLRCYSIVWFSQMKLISPNGTNLGFVRNLETFERKSIDNFWWKTNELSEKKNSRQNFWLVSKEKKFYGSNRNDSQSIRSAPILMIPFKSSSQQTTTNTAEAMKWNDLFFNLFSKLYDWNVYWIQE